MTKNSEGVSSLGEEITERAGLMMAMNVPKAVFGIVDVLDDPSQLGARNAISEAREVLDRTGMAKKEKVEVTGQTGCVFIPPSKTAANDDKDPND